MSGVNIGPLSFKVVLAPIHQRLPPAREGVPAWIDPEGIHAVENIGGRPFEGIRIELKD
ncbi:MAG: hypothetical protein QF787_16530 [Nitrospinota bacterium]|nr:hypothetical protein [Nitrospinota bacterium]